MTGELQGLIDEDYLSHTKVKGKKKLTFHMLDALFNISDKSLISTSDEEGLNIAECCTDYAAERKTWLRKRAIVKFRSDSKIAADQQFFELLNEELDLKLIKRRRQETYDANDILKALEKSQGQDRRKTIIIIEKLGEQDPEKAKHVLDFIKYTLSFRSKV